MIVERGSQWRAGAGAATSPLTAISNSGFGAVGGFTGYTAGDVIHAWIRHRSTITACYLTNAGDPGVGNAYAQRVDMMLDGDVQLAGTAETDGVNKLAQAVQVIPNNGNTYDRIVTTLAGGSTANEVLSTAYQFGNGLILPRDVNADRRAPGSSSPPGATPSNITQLDFDVQGLVHGLNELILVAVASSAVVNTQAVLAGSGFTLLPTPATVSSPRLVAAYKVTAPVNAAAGGVTRLSWGGTGTSVVGRTTSLQEIAPVTVIPVKMAFTGEAIAGIRVSRTDTTTKVPVRAHFFGQDRFRVELGVEIFENVWIPHNTVIDGL